jgi:hypothetical protein
MRAQRRTNGETERIPELRNETDREKERERGGFSRPYKAFRHSCSTTMYYFSQSREKERDQIVYIAAIHSN